MGLAQEFGLRPWVRGGAELGAAQDRVVAGKAVAILDVTVPDAKYAANQQWLKDGPDGAAVPQVQADTDGAGRPVAVKDTAAAEPARPAADPYVEQARRIRASEERERLQPLVKAGGDLAKRGVPLMLGATTAKDLIDHVRTQVRFGLDKEACLEALTEGPARLLGLDRAFGRVGEGYRADLAVFDGDPFAGANVIHVFCRGERYDLPRKTKQDAGKKPSGDAAAARVVGTWKVAVEGRDEETTLKLEKSAAGVGGTCSFSRGDGDVTSVEVEGDKVRIVCEISGQGVDVEITFDATLDKEGKTLSGEMQFGDFGSRPFKATKGDGR
jgi:hypothetical protein